MRRRKSFRLGPTEGTGAGACMGDEHAPGSRRCMGAQVVNIGALGNKQAFVVALNLNPLFMVSTIVGDC